MPVLLAATVGEEGLGDLRGIRAVLDAHPASRRDRARGPRHRLGRDGGHRVGALRASRYRGPGGHSWRDRDRPSAIHVLFDTGRGRHRRGSAGARQHRRHLGRSARSTRSPARRAWRSISAPRRTTSSTAACARIEQVLAAVPRGIDAEIVQAGRRPGGRHATSPPAAARGAAGPDAGRAAAGARGRRLDRRQRGARPRHPGRDARASRAARRSTATDEWIELAPLVAGVATVDAPRAPPRGPPGAAWASLSACIAPGRRR